MKVSISAILGMDHYFFIGGVTILETCRQFVLKSSMLQTIFFITFLYMKLIRSFLGHESSIKVSWPRNDLQGIYVQYI